jgi:hypothetical protein
MTADDIKFAALEGRAADPGTPNPYAGQGALATAWMLGYKRMLLDMLDNSPARQAWLNANRSL